MLKHAQIITHTQRVIRQDASLAVGLIRRGRRFLNDDAWAWLDNATPSPSTPTQLSKIKKALDRQDQKYILSDEGSNESNAEVNNGDGSSTTKDALASRLLYSRPPILRHADILSQVQRKTKSRTQQSESSDSSGSQASRRILSILEEKPYEEMMKEAEEATERSKSESDHGAIRRRAMEWRWGKQADRTGEFRRASTSSSGSVEQKMGSENEEDTSRTARQNDESRRDSEHLISSTMPLRQRMTFSLNSAHSRMRQPFKTKLHIKYLLPIYKEHESQRAARVRRNDRRNLSYLDAEAKLGMVTELYNATFASGKTRGGNGRGTWRREIERFERETGQKATWLRRKGEVRLSQRGAENVRAVETKQEKDSFMKVWGDLAVSMQEGSATG